MKKTLFIVLMLALAHSIHAQLVVDSLGRVGVGTVDTLRSQLAIGTGGDSNTTLTLKSQKATGMYLFNQSSQPLSTGLKVRADYSKNGIGIWSRTMGIGSDSYYSSAVVGHAGSRKKAAGVLGGLSNISCESGAGIYGTSNADVYAHFDYPGVYAGYFRGDMLTTGKIIGTLYSSATGASELQTQTVSTKATIGNKYLPFRNKNGNESVLNKLTEIPTLEFMETVMEVPSTDVNTIRILDEMMKNGDEFQTTTKLEESQTGLKDILRHGVDAEKLSEIYPELVSCDNKGNYLVNYVDMVPLLLQSIRELKAELEELKSDKNIIATKKAKATSIESGTESTDIVRMSQNTPNPFSESSVITLNIPEDTKNAAIYIYDLSGKQVKNINVEKRGETDINVLASDLTEGMFVYSLIIDGTVAATRRMMVVRN